MHECVMCETRPRGSIDYSILLVYCRVPEGRGLQQTASPPSRDETWSDKPLMREQVDITKG